MGNSQSNQSQPHHLEHQPQPQKIPQTPAQRWTYSQQTQQDLILLISSSETLAQSSNLVNHFINSITSREKYQNYLIAVLDELRSLNSTAKFQQGERKRMFTTLSRKLKFSFFATQDFHSKSLQGLKPSEQLYFLYEYYSLSQDLLQKALFFNYPSIFTQFPQFLITLIQNEILITNQDHFYRLIVPYLSINSAKDYFQLISPSFTQNQHQKLLGQISSLQNLKKIYLSGAQVLLQFDYVEIACGIYYQLVVKGYQLQEDQMQCYLKLEMYYLFLYHYGKLGLREKEFRLMNFVEIFHFFYSNYQLEETPRFRSCFKIYGEYAEGKWQEYALHYLFSSFAHVSTMIRFAQYSYVNLSGKDNLFPDLLIKLKDSSCDIGKYADGLNRFGLLFRLDRKQRQNYMKFIKLLEICNTFNMHCGASGLYQIAHINWSMDGDRTGYRQEIGMELLRRIISAYFVSFEVKTKIIQIEQYEYNFGSIFGVLKFLQSLKAVFLKDLINDCVTHQIFFKELLTHGYYIEIKALLDRKQQFRIQQETVRMLIIDHAIDLITTKRVMKIQETIKLLLSILNIHPDVSSSSSPQHYLLAYYNYLRYLQDKDISITNPMKQRLSINNLYYIVQQYSNRIDNIDFNFLFTQQACVQAGYIGERGIFLPVVTDEFLKFKIYLCQQAYSSRKIRLGAQIIEQVIRYQPPWLSSELVKLIRQNGSSIQQNFILIAFNYCSRGDDLQYLLDLYDSRPKKGKLSLHSLKTWTNSIIDSDSYLTLSQEVVIDEGGYKDHVAQLTFNEAGEIKSNHYLFFHLLTIEPQRAFNYAINYGVPSSFLVNFLVQAVRKHLVHQERLLPFLIRYLYFALAKDSHSNVQNLPYIYYIVYCQKPFNEIVKEAGAGGPRKSFIGANLQKMIRNYQIRQAVTQQFLQLHVHSSSRFKFLYEDTFRRQVLADLREHPMSKNNCKVLRAICCLVGVDIVELSVYSLASRVGSREEMDGESWTICQKLACWGAERESACIIVQKLIMKIQDLQILAGICDYLRQSEASYRQVITDYHMAIISSLASIAQGKNLHGIISQDFFGKEISVHPPKVRGMITDSQRRVLQSAGKVENIFVLSKALYFMYGCSEQIEKVVLGEFSLKQEDCQEFEELRRKVRTEYMKII